MDSKDTNPKDAVGIRKWRTIACVPFTVLWEVGVGMLEGARKYGRHNYRVAGVRGSVYVEAAMGHIMQWWEGEDLDPDTELSHITKAICSLVVMRDAMIHGTFTDDRPPKTNVDSLRIRLQERVDDIFDRIEEPREAYVEGDQYEDAGPSQEIFDEWTDLVKCRWVGVTRPAGERIQFATSRTEEQLKEQGYSDIVWDEKPNLVSLEVIHLCDLRLGSKWERGRRIMQPGGEVQFEVETPTGKWVAVREPDEVSNVREYVDLGH